MTAGDVLIGVASSGVHSNGYSLVRRVVEQSGQGYGAPAPFARDMSLGQALLAPTRLYVKSVLEAIHTGGVKGLAHITGGGITDNLPRAIADGLDAEVDLSSWHPSAVFGWLARVGGISEAEMLRTFNCGIGLVVIASANSAGHVIDAFQESGDRATRIGTLVVGEGEPKMRYRGALKL
jgi:phosphoribosylformylglycinamidine cyclo-ligase